MRNIGPFYVEDCCLENGFDELGNPKVREAKLVSQEEADKLEIVKSTNIVQNYGTGEIISQKESSPEELKEMIKERKKRNYNKNGQVNIKKDE